MCPIYGRAKGRTFGRNFHLLHTLCIPAVKTLVRLHMCTDLSQPSLVAVYSLSYIVNRYANCDFTNTDFKSFLICCVCALVLVCT